MEIKISQVVAKMPEKKYPDCTESYLKCGTTTQIMAVGYNQALSEVSDLPISKDKAIGMVEFDREKLADLLCRFIIKGGLACSPNTYKQEYYKRADAIIAAKSDILTIKGNL